MMFAVWALFTNPWISEYLLYQSSIHTASQANTIHAFACGNPTHNLEVVSTPKPTTITLLLAISIFSQSRLGVCEQLPFLSWSVLLSHCDMPLTSMLFKHRPRRQQQAVCLGLRPQLYGSDVLASVLILTTVWVVWCLPFHAFPWSCQLVNDIWERASVTPPNLIGAGFGCTTYLLFFQLWCMIIFVLPLMWFLDSLDWPHCPATHKHSILNLSMACQRPPSVIAALCCVLWPRPSLICAGHVLAPAASIFILWFSPWPPSWLQAGALL